MTSLAFAASTKRLNRAAHLPVVRAALEEQRCFRSDQLAELAAAAQAWFPGTADEPHGEVADALRAGASIAVSEIDAALDRLGNGSYGRCEGCEDAIPLERLEILPMASLCARYQHAQETHRRCAVRMTRSRDRLREPMTASGNSFYENT